MENFFDIKVKDILTKTTIYQYLRRIGYSEHYLTNLRKPEMIFLNNQLANMRTIVKSGDIISISKNPYKKTDIKTSDKPIDIIFEDEYYLICNKPSHLATTPTRSHYDDNLSARICFYMSKSDDNFTLRVMNRLDMEASGIIVVAKDAITYQATDNIQKTYYAVCHNVLSKERIVELPIYTENINGINTMKRICSPLGQYAKTTLTPIKSFDNKTLLEVHIEKGRTHQIRVHSSEIGYPLLGDKIYGIDDNFDRLFLHLKKLSFHNKITDKQYDISIDLPKEFEEIQK